MRSRTPLSPEARALLAATGGTSRRNLMRGALVGGMMTAAGGTLAACGDGRSPSVTASSTRATCNPPDVSARERKAVFSNWLGYMDSDENDKKRHPTLDNFKARTGIDVKYQEDINDNDEFLGKIHTQLGGCQTIDRDIVVFTDWMAGKFIGLGYAAKLDDSKVSTFRKNLLPPLQRRAFDPTMSYAAPWQSGLTGVAYNSKVAKEIKSIDELFTRADLKGKVTFLTEMNDTIGLTLLTMGKNPRSFTRADFDAALEKLHRAAKSGQIRKFTGNDYTNMLAKGDIAACVAWSGDVIQLNADNDKIKFVMPEEGMMIWSDNMMIPVTSTHASNAMSLIDYYYDPKIAAELAAWVNYICPVAGAQDAMRAIDKSLADNPLIFPDLTILEKTHGFAALDEATRKKYATEFQAVISARQ